ncbi:hypothetical protein ACFLZ2_01115, partial [Candidatus Margulisiibacteriota bacterium]
AIDATKLAAGSVTSGAIADGTIAAADMGTDSVTSDAIADGTIIGDDLAADISISTTGIVTAAEFFGDGANLQNVPGVIADGTITAAKMATDSVTAAAIATGAVGADEIADGSITAADMGTDSVTSGAIADGTIVGGDLATNISISTTGIVTASAIYGSNVYIPAGGNAYLSSGSTSGMSALVVPMVAAGSITAGDVVIYDTTADNQVKTTVSAADQAVMGFAVNSATAGNPVYVAVSGRVTNAKTKGTDGIVKGDYLETTDLAGAVRPVSPKLTVGSTVGIALTDEGGGTVTVWIHKF